MTGRQTQFNCSKNLISQEINGETVLLDMDRENYSGLNTAGTRIWQLLQEPRSAKGIVAVMILEYNIEEDQLKVDLNEIVDQLLNNRILIKLKDSSNDA